MLTTSGGESTAPTSPSRTESHWHFTTPNSPSSPISRQTTYLNGTNGDATVPSPQWHDFSDAGFEFMGPTSLAGSLADFSPTPPRKTASTVTSSRRTSRSRDTRRRKSLEIKPVANGTIKEEVATEFPTKDSSAIVSECVDETLQLDEAMIEGWSDTLLDRTVASAWPTFALYHLRTPLTAPVPLKTEETTVQWLAIETYVHAVGSHDSHEPPTEPPSPTRANTKRSSSVRSDKRRFGFFSSTTSLTGKDGKEKEKKRGHSRKGSDASVDAAIMGAKIKGRTILVAFPILTLFCRCFHVPSQSTFASDRRRTRAGYVGSAYSRGSPWYASSSFSLCRLLMSIRQGDRAEA